VTSLCLMVAALLTAPAATNVKGRLAAVVGPRAGSGSVGPSAPRTDTNDRRGSTADPLAVAAGWDLLAASLRAGLPIAEALRAIADGVPAAAADALRRTSELLALGAPGDEAWRPAAACPATAPLAHAARRSAQSGSALAEAVDDMAARLRAEQIEAAETRAQRAGVLVTGPLGLCFLPSFLCLGVVPVVIGLAGQLTVLP